MCVSAVLTCEAIDVYGPSTTSGSLASSHQASIPARRARCSIWDQ